MNPGRFASAITMGLAWGGGGLIEAPFTGYFQDIGRPQSAVWAFLPFVAIAGVSAMWLPAPGAVAEADGDRDKPETGT